MTSQASSPTAPPPRPPARHPDFGAARPGEVKLETDPATMPGDAHLVFIGRLHSPWKERGSCPKNLREARERSAAENLPSPWLEIDPTWRPGLAGLASVGHIVVLAWFDRARRDLIVQSPRHASEPRGVFALRSPVRPNPIALEIVAVVGVDATAGRIDIDATDLLDGTPIIDIKPHLASIDAVLPLEGRTTAAVP